VATCSLQSLCPSMGYLRAASPQTHPTHSIPRKEAPDAQDQQPNCCAWERTSEQVHEGRFARAWPRHQRSVQHKPVPIKHASSGLCDSLAAAGLLGMCTWRDMLHGQQCSEPRHSAPCGHGSSHGTCRQESSMQGRERRAPLGPTMATRLPMSMPMFRPCRPKSSRPGYLKSASMSCSRHAHPQPLT